MNKELIPHWDDDDSQNLQLVPTNQLNKESNSSAGFIINCTACGQPIEIAHEQEGMDFLCPSCNAPFTAQPQGSAPQWSFQRPIPPPPPSPPSSQFSRARVVKISGITLAILVVVMVVMNRHWHLKTIAHDFINSNEMITDAEADEDVREGMEEARQEGVERGSKFAEEYGRVPTKLEYAGIYDKLKYEFWGDGPLERAYTLFERSGLPLDEYNLSEMQSKIEKRYAYEYLLGFEEGCRRSLALIQEVKSPPDPPQPIDSSLNAHWYGFGYELGATLRVAQQMTHAANIARKEDLRNLLSSYVDLAQMPQEEFDWCYSGFSDGVFAKTEQYPKQDNPPRLK